MPPLQASDEFYDNQKAITAEVLAAARKVWGTRPPANFDAWFAKNVDRLVAIVELGQQSAIAGVGDYVDAALAEQGMAPQVLANVDTGGLIGVASDGRPLDSLMYGSVITAKGAIERSVGSGAEPSTVVRTAWESGLQALLLRVQTQVADASRVATGMQITSRRDTGYVRMLNPPSCARCTVLAGRFYRFSAGFLRHPGCDCRHVPSTEDAADDLRTDPMFQFLALPMELQDRIYTKAGAQAIRDGADMGQVVNARRGANGLATAGRLERRDVYGQQLFTTTEGVTKRGVAGKVIRGRGRTPKTTPRLMPEDIYEITGGDRGDALRMLELNGYVLRRSGPTAGAGSRTSLVPDLADAADVTRRAVPPVNLDAATPAPTKAPARKRAPRPAPVAVVEPEFSPGLSAFERSSLDRFIEAVPASARASLRKSGVSVVIAKDFTKTSVGTRYAGKDTADGRPLSSLSFFDIETNTVLIQVRNEGGSVNVVAHEMGHALDLNHLKADPPTVVWQEQGSRSLNDRDRASIQAPFNLTVSEFASDPYLRYAHSLVRKSSTGDQYYKTGSAGNQESGLREWIAESYASLVMGNENDLLSIAGGRTEAVDIMRWSLNRYGVLS